MISRRERNRIRRQTKRLVADQAKWEAKLLSRALRVDLVKEDGEVAASRFVGFRFHRDGTLHDHDEIAFPGAVGTFVAVAVDGQVVALFKAETSDGDTVVVRF